MRIKTILLNLLVLYSIQGFSQGNFYSSDTIREIRLVFSQDNWDELLDNLYIAGDKDRLVASLIVDGYSYDSVGVRYKGFSSASITRTKNPFNIKLNYLIQGQSHQGIDKIKLSNIIQDPSFLREVLSYEIIRKYMPASEANFANVYVNDSLIGLYSNVEAVNKEFLEKHFSSPDQVLVKGNPEEINLYGDNSNLSQSPGTDSMAYASFYSIKSDFGWSALYNFIDTLNNFEQELAKHLNIDQALWMHALNYALVNFDSYVGYAQNYYLYRDHQGRFNPIMWDLNMSFASFRLADASDYFDGFSITQAKTIDPLSHFESFSVYARPLMRNIFNQDRYRKMYLAHIRTIIEENFSNLEYLFRSDTLRQLIDFSVLNDPNKFYSYSAFQENLYNTVSDLIDYPGIVDLMEDRSLYLSQYPGFMGAPSLEGVTHVPQDPVVNESILIHIQAPKMSVVSLFYRHAPSVVFQELQMNDQGTAGDLIAEDGVFSAQISFQGAELSYYIYAENDSAGAFSPLRAAYEYHTIQQRVQTGDIVINEVLANNNINVNEEGLYSDWIELFNRSEKDLFLSGLYLTDEKSLLSKWALPDLLLYSGAYLIVWADDLLNLEGNHANFKLSSQGEDLFLSSANGMQIDSLTFPAQIENISFGRFPNGFGEFMFLSPTFNLSNDQANIIPSEKALVFKPHPNPFVNDIVIDIESQQNTSIYVTDLQGKIVLQQSFPAGIFSSTLLTPNLIPGCYLLYLYSSDFVITRKMVKI